MQLLCCYLLLLLAGGSSVVDGFAQIVHSLDPTASSQCGVQQDDPQLVAALEQVKQQLGPPGCNPSRNRSCLEILQCFPSTLSGYYQIQTANNSYVQVYCYMEGTNCGGEGGWMRVAYVNMTQEGATCPRGLAQRTVSGLTLCGRNNSGCDGTMFSTFGLNYSRVCGQVRGYQQGSTDAFFNALNFNSITVDDDFLDGVCITHGNSPRKHIWSYASGLYLNGYTDYVCPCNSNVNTQVPSFIGNDYYCETGNNVELSFNYDTLYTNDTLWDGQQCVGPEAPCCTHPDMPWFIKTLNETTSEDIELRVCSDQHITNEDTPIEVIELLVY